MNKKSRLLILTGSILGFLGVALGAFGAHALKGSVSEEMMEAYKTGILYHLIHSVVVTAIGFSKQNRFNSSGFIFSAGILLFSFSLYLHSITQYKPLVFITPLGGILLLIGWLTIIIQTIRIKNDDQ